MNKILFFIIFIASCVFIASRKTSCVVEACPDTEEKWQERARDFNCKSLDGKYHCFPTLNNSYIEMCRHPVWFNGTDGCPVLEWINDEFQIVTKVCTLNGSACYHSYIQSNRMYKYPICLTFIKQICALNISTVPSSNISCQHFQDTHTISLTPSMSVIDKVAGQSTAHESSKDWKTSLKVITSQIVQKDVNITNGVTRSSNNPIKEENNKQNAFIGLAALVVSILLLALFFAYLYKRYQALTDLSRSINAMSDRTPRISIPPQADDEVYFEIYEIEECPVAELETDSRKSRYINDRATVEPQKHTTC